MDLMDLDDIVDVPDSPDRLPKPGIRTENQRSPLPCHGHKMVFEEGSREQPMIIDSGSPALSLHPPKCPSSPKNHRRPPTSASFSLSSSSSSRNTPLFRKWVTEKKPNHLTHGSVLKHQESLKPSYTSQSSSSSQAGIIDMGEWSHRPACGNASLSAVPGKNQVDLQKRSVLPNGASSSRELSNLANASHNVNEEMNNFARGGFGVAFGEGALHGGSNKKKPDVSPVHIVPPRVNKQKRLVRNGCISPNNIAKAKQLVGKDSSSSVAVAKNNGSIVSNAPPVSIEIRELVAEDNDSLARKGKGAISQPGRLDPETNNFHGRSSMSYNEKAVERTGYNGGAGKSFEGRGGCKTTCNRTRETDNLSSFDKEHHSTRERVSPRVSIQHHEKTLDRRGKGITPANGDNHSKDLNTLIKRQKHRSGLSRHGECSTSTSVDPDVVLLSSPTEAASLRSTTSNAKNIPQVIDVVESPPQVRCATHDEDDKARQVEADELLARELQEQFYNEMPVFGVPEVNEHIASLSPNGLSRGLSRGMQAIEAVNEHIASRVQNGLSRGLSRGMQAIEARLMADLRRQSPRHSSNSRRGALARSSSLGRMTRQRSRFPGQPRTLSSSRGRTSIFPPDMDVDMRMHILGALEEFSGMGTTAGILHADRDFNEDDYEMLLALDDNISHGGASAHQINGLPLSTAQSDFEEACAVCLDTPTAGDTIRHLPCLHKFHKDCIDPWLRRRTSCPVCKSSIT